MKKAHNPRILEVMQRSRWYMHTLALALATFGCLFVLPLPAVAGSTPASKAQIEVIRSAMRETLKDAESARFINVRFGTGKHDSLACGEVNSKNSFGAYAGYKYFMVSYWHIPNSNVPDKAVVLGVDHDGSDSVKEVCKSAGLAE